MQLSIITAIILLAASALAGHNCKFQDDNGKYNDLTNYCCYSQHEENILNDITYHGGQVHQLRILFQF